MPVRLASSLLLSMLLGCAQTPVGGGDRGQGRMDRNGYYVVKSGDTLAEIAASYGFDYRELAGINGLRYPYLIRPGDRIAVKGRAVKRERALSSMAAAGQARAAPVRGAAAPSSPPARAASASRPASGAGTAVPVSAQTSSPVGSRQGASSSPEPWRWPATGAVVKAYSESGKVHKGIDIGGKTNQPVMAAKGGKVVYAGTGLKAYGLLVIIKHDDHYLSAYAYNEKAFVVEGDHVRQGQKIALMGTREDGQARLHFEIRKDGKPLNPITLLPGR